MTLIPKPAKALELFYSYAHKDELWRKKLETHLSNLQKQGFVAGWHDRNISAGTAWEYEVDRHLNTADIILLLISSDFVASEYCYSIEMKRAIERHKAGEARVIPIILRPTDWKGTRGSSMNGPGNHAKPPVAFTRTAFYLRTYKRSGHRRDYPSLRFIASRSQLA